jgi:hypothetical protein
MGAIVSLHGSSIGFDRDLCGLVTKRIKKGLIKQFTITSAQLLALNATPITILAAPGAGLASILRGIHLYKPAGTAYAGVAAGEDLAVKYTDASGSIASTIEATGFVDSASATRAFGAPSASCFPVANAALVLHMLTGEIITGNSALFGWLEYDVYPFALDLLPLS